MRSIPYLSWIFLGLLFRGLFTLFGSLLTVLIPFMLASLVLLHLFLFLFRAVELCLVQKNIFCSYACRF